MHNSVHNRVSMNTAAKTAVPILALVLRTENCGSAVITALNQFEDEVLFDLRHVIQQPFVKNQQSVSAELFQDFGSAVYIHQEHECIWF